MNCQQKGNLRKPFRLDWIAYSQGQLCKYEVVFIFVVSGGLYQTAMVPLVTVSIREEWLNVTLTVPIAMIQTGHPPSALSTMEKSGSHYLKPLDMTHYVKRGKKKSSKKDREKREGTMTKVGRSDVAKIKRRALPGCSVPLASLCCLTPDLWPCGASSQAHLCDITRQGVHLGLIFEQEIQLQNLIPQSASKDGSLDG